MDKKQLEAVVASIVADVAAQHSLEESEARTLVGIALKKNRAAFISAVTTPTLGLVPNPSPAV